MREMQIRQEIVQQGRSLYERGLAFGSAGNISVRCEDGFLMTPTRSSMGNLDPARISKIDRSGTLLDGDPPTKESLLHLAVYEKRPNTHAVVHLHSTHTVALTCMKHDDYKNILPPITPYFIMRVGKLILLPYYPPGDPRLAQAVREAAGDYKSILLANHGSVIADVSLSSAVYASEELEETAKLYFLLHGHPSRFLTPNEVTEIENRFPPKG